MYEPTAKSILDFADALPGPYGFERSIKFSSGVAYANRFLISFPSVALRMGADLSSLLVQLKLPSGTAWQDLIAGKDVLHLGVEGGDQVSTCKLYAENAAEVRALWETSLPVGETIAVHRALKWRAGDTHAVSTDYDWLPCSCEADLISQVEHYTPFALALYQALLALVRGRCDINDLQLLRVSEASEGRLSLDLNLYEANLTVTDAIPSILAYLPDMAVVAGDLLALQGDQSLGHIAAGVGRDGLPFLTVYYGAHERGSFIE